MRWRDEREYLEKAPRLERSLLVLITTPSLFFLAPVSQLITLILLPSLDECGLSRPVCRADRKLPGARIADLVQGVEVHSTTTPCDLHCPTVEGAIEN